MNICSIKVGVLILALFYSCGSASSQRSRLRLAGFVASRAYVEVSPVSNEEGVFELAFMKNTPSLNFKLVLEPYERKPAGEKNQSKFRRLYVLSARGERRRLDFRKMKMPTRHMRMTIISP